MLAPKSSELLRSHSASSLNNGANVDLTLENLQKFTREQERQHRSEWKRRLSQQVCTSIMFHVQLIK